MRWQQTEFILKGIYLGLLLFVALREPDWADVATVAGCTLGGLALFLAVAAFRKLREGYRVRGRLSAFVLFLLLENPGSVYAGILLGLTLGAYTISREEDDNYKLLATVGVGAALGVIFLILRHVRDSKLRLWLGLALAVVLIGGGVGLFILQSNLLPQRHMIGVLLLLGIPLFYVLTFASMVEESEVEIAAICAALGVGLWIVGDQYSMTFQNLALALPVVLYLVYTRRILPGLRVFKHVLRGLSYATVGRYQWALLSLRRALELDPNSALAREQLWNVHRQMDFTQIVREPDTLALVDFEMCLQRVTALLLTTPKAAHLQEAHRLLDLVSSQRPDMQPRCDYWRAVAACHEHQYDQAAAALENVLAARDSSPDNPHRQVILVPAWQLALLLHPEMNRRVGVPQLAQPGRRMEAIAAVERHLAANPDDKSIWDLKRILYHDLTEADYPDVVPEGKAAADFDHGYAHQLGLALISDAARWERGAEYLRLAARGLAQLGPSLYIQIARANERAGNIEACWRNYELAKQAGRAAGPNNLSEEDKHAFFAVVKMLAEAEKDNGNLDAAIENYHLYSEYERAGLETYRQLAELYERKKDAWSALHATERGLVYDGSDQDLLQRKDRYYYSVTPEELRARMGSVSNWFDVNYCIRKARWLLDRGSGDLDLVDWAGHLLDLAQVARSGNFTVRLQRARIRRLRGEDAEAIALLEEVRTNKPEKFASAEEEESWYLSCRLLGDLYLQAKPELALQCFQEFRQSAKSGADTVYKMGVAYENLGDRARAAKCYQQVVAFESHPLAPEAHEALERLQASRS